VIIGPTAPHHPRHRGVTLAERGVIFLLFTIGLELSLDRLSDETPRVRPRHAAGRRHRARWGLAVVALGTPPRRGHHRLSAALSSTAIVVQILMERGEFATQYGRASFAVLLFQDLAVVPILVLITIFGDREQSVAVNLALAVAKAVGAVGVIVLAGRFLLRPLYRIVAATRSPEILMATTLLAILVIASITGVAGLDGPRRLPRGLLLAIPPTGTRSTRHPALQGPAARPVLHRRGHADRHRRHLERPSRFSAR
jgi:CPA2 family monovalent cation:H+ antiporter-2